jgi:hypothetical protein
MRMCRWLAILLTLVSLDAAAQAVGRVLIAAGEVTATRAGRTVALASGSELENGDLVATGEASSAQLRFNDETVVALRDRSRFHIADYRFTGADDGVSQAAFNLLKGGLRTITGLIGRARPERYRLRTPLATVGVRGTAYSLVHCEQDCEADDGTMAADGTYGLVFEGRIAVANEGGEREFGADEAFFVADATSPPQPLLARPRLLRDRLEARARREERREQMEARAQAIAAQREAAARFAVAAAARTGDPNARPVALIGTALSPIVVSDLKDASGNVALLGPGLGAGVGFAAANIPVAIVDGGRGTVIVLDGQRGFLERFSFNGGAQAGDRGNVPVVDNGRIDGDGGAVWGRWAPGAAVQVGGVTGTPSTGVHFFFGNLTPESLFGVMPAGATAVRYDYAGGPRPTDGQGNAGQFLAGSFIVNFVNRSIGGDLSYRIAAVTYTLPVPQGTALVPGRGFIGFNVAQRGAGSWSSALGNASGTLDAYAVSGIFLGSRAQGLGITFAPDDARAGRSAGAGIFRCVSGGCR